MKKRYLFPIIYLVLLCLAFIIPGMGDYLMVLTYPVDIPIFFISLALGGPRDTAIPAFIAGIGQFYLIGVAFDWVAAWWKEPMSN